MKKMIKVALITIGVVILIMNLIACKGNGVQEFEEDTTNREESMHIHQYGEWEIVTPATCTECGERRRVCSCGKKEEEIISALGHEIISHEAKKATVDEIGWDAYDTCIRCNYTTFKTIPALTPSEGFSFSLQSNDTYQIIDIGTCTDNDILLPLTYEGKLVTSIGSNAFSDCASITAITIPEGITLIGENAFYRCFSLSSISLPSSLISIPDNAFRECTALSSITIPISVTSIGDSAFFGCSALTAISIPLHVTKIGDSAFGGCSSLKDITIPFVGAVADKTSEDIEQYPFGYIFGTTEYEGSTAVEQFYYGQSTSSRTSSTYYLPSSLNNVNITGGNILYGAFYSCNMLNSIILPANLENIGKCAFYHCTGLTSITIPENVSKIESLAFSGCNRLVEIYNKSSIEIAKDSKNGNIGYYSKNIYTKEGGSRLTIDTNGYLLYRDETVYSLIRYFGSESKLSLPDGITEINQYAFINCDDLKSIAMPNSIATIGAYAFRGCSGLTNIAISNTLTNISTAAFIGCSNLSTITLPRSLNVIESSAFSGCRLTTIYYEGDIVSWCKMTDFDSGLMTEGTGPGATGQAKTLIIGGKTIEGSLTIPNDVTQIRSFAFAGCALSEITIPNTVTAIQEKSFCGCTGLTSISIPDGVISIGESAFMGCSNLKTVTLPASLTSVGDDVFVWCDGVNIYFQGTLFNWCSIPDLEGLMRYNVSSLYISGTKITGAITIPYGTTRIPDYAFYSCSGISSISIPSTVERIGTNAFFDCSITSVSIPNGVSYVDGFAGCDNLKTITIPASVSSLGNHAFSSCKSLSSITYRGTKKQWNAIFKGSGWDYRMPSCIIHCSDGDINK